MGPNPVKIILAFAILVTSGSSLLATDAKPEILVTLGRDKTYENEPVRYGVVLDHVDRSVTPDMSALEKDFQVKLLDSEPLDSTHTIVQDGKLVEVGPQKFGFLYTLTPRKTGTLAIPSPTVTLPNGEKLTGRNLTIEVRSSTDQNQDQVRLYLTATPKSVFLTQEFEVTVAVAIKALSGRLADEDPLEYLQAPILVIPWCNLDDSLPAGIHPARSAERWLSHFRSIFRDGFTILVGKNRGITHIAPTPKRITLPDASGRDTTYWLYEFPRRFVANRPGEFKVGPAALQGVFLDEFTKNERRKISIKKGPLTITVKEVPTEGRPASYCGAVGRFSGWTATLTPTKTRVDSPITLTLTLTGTGSTAEVEPPDLAKIPAITKNFKTYEGTRQDERGAVKFVYSLRPENDKIKEFPPVPLSYFDLDTGQFKTMETRPIPIEVSPAERLSSSQIVGAVRQMSQNQGPEANSEGVFGNIPDSKELYDQTPRPMLWFGVLGGLAIAYGILMLGTKRYRRLHEDADRVRRRSAAGVARGRIAEGRRLLTSGETTRGAEEVHAALAGLVAAAAGLPESGMTTADACRRLEAFEAPQQLINDLRELFETCDATRYGGADATLHGLVDKLDALLTQTITTLKKQKRLC